VSSDLLRLWQALALAQRVYARHLFECHLCCLNMHVTCAKRLQLEFDGMEIEARFGEAVAA